MGIISVTSFVSWVSAQSIVNIEQTQTYASYRDIQYEHRMAPVLSLIARIAKFFRTPANTNGLSTATQVHRTSIVKEFGKATKELTSYDQNSILWVHKVTDRIPHTTVTERLNIRKDISRLFDIGFD